MPGARGHQRGAGRHSGGRPHPPCLPPLGLFRSQVETSNCNSDTIATNAVLIFGASQFKRIPPIARAREMREKVIRSLVPWLLLLVALVLVLAQVRRPAALINVGEPWAEIGTLAIVMTAIILTGGIDLSLGSTVALCGIVLGVLWQDVGLPIYVAIVGAILCGLLAGSVNGLLINGGLSPLVATLATMAFYRGLAMALSRAERITGFPESALRLQHLGGFPTQYGLLAVTCLLGIVVVHYSRFGRWCFAMGDNRLAARFAAVPVGRVELSLYSASGLVAGLIGVLHTFSHDAAVPDALRGVELQVIACVVVGGTLITGGQGSIARTLLGLGVVALLDIGLRFLSTRLPILTAESRLIVVGVLVLAVAIWNERGRRDVRTPG